MSDLMLQPAETVTETTACWPLMQLLRPYLTSAEMFLEQVARQRMFNYRLLVAWKDGEAVALAGWRLQENCAYGRHIYVDDLVTRPDRRGQGLGARLIARLAGDGNRLGCVALVLDTAVNNSDAQRFYARSGLRNRALSFSMKLKDVGCCETKAE
jgi:GNAT superfamily N-acetyltransferase